MKIYYYNGTLWRDVTALDSSFCEETIDRFNRISLDFVLPSEELVPELCHVTWRGDKYTLYTVPKVVKVSTREYRYTLILEGRYKELERTLVKDKLGRTKFVFTGRADQYADLISGCIDGWSTGNCTTGDRTQVIAFSNNSLLEACRMVASKFETEVQLDGGKISFGRVEKYKGDPLTLAYRQGLQKEITTEPDSKETALGRLYVMGGEHNIDPAKYGSRTLHLPKGGSLSVEGHTFRVDAEGRYISLDSDTRLNTSERALDATTIYPKRVGTISKVEQKGDEWDVIDETNPIDYTQHRVGGDVMRLEFQSGRLAGRSFDLTTKDDKLTGYVHAEKRFRLVRREVDGVLMPEPGTFFPSVGDKYAIFGCSLPDEYIKSAEAEMLSTAAKYMAERLEARVQYRAELDGLFAKKNWSTVAHKLTIGTIVRLEGTAKDVRISSVRTSLNSPYTPRITFSNAPYMVGSLTTQIATIESAEVRTREETRQSLLSLQARTYEDTKVVREMIERLRVEGFTQTIKPETLQSMYAVIGSPALQFDFVRGGGSVPFSWSESKGGTIIIPGQSIQRKASGTTLEPGDTTTVTDIPALTYTLKAEEQQAYVYTELSPAPHFVISTKPLAISPDRLLVGLLNGEEGKRAFTPLYGFTEITPGQLKTDLIRSQDGKSYWDLLSGKFATTGDLLIGDPTGDTCLAYIDGVLYVKGLMVNVGSSSTTIEDALLEQERKIENAKKVRQPIIKNGTWWVWDDTTNQLIDSGKPAQGAPGKDVDPKVLNDLKAAVDDARRKLDDTVTKAELDGVVSAQEEHDIQAAKAALDAAKKAYDDAVKRAKELDGEIQVGGRNLAVGGEKKVRLSSGIRYIELSEPLQKDTSYTLSFDVEVHTPPADRRFLVYLGYSTHLFTEGYVQYADGATHYSITLHTPDKKGDYNSNLRTAYLYPHGWRDGYNTVTDVTFSRVKLERGTVATDWTPAPEDLQAAMEEVAQAKAELAETKSKAYADGKITATEQLAIDKAAAAYKAALKKAKELDAALKGELSREIAAAKEQATRAQQSTDNLKGYVDGTYKDGIITEVESKTIATYINEVEAMWSSAFGAFEKVYVNPLLTGTPKTALSDAKITLAGAKDNLISQIRRAISDGKATKAEATETERLYNVYKGALRDFQRALKSAEEAIRDAGKTTGGRNLAVGASEKSRVSTGSSLVIHLSEPLQRDTSYTLSFDVEVYTPPADRQFLVYLGYNTPLFASTKVPYTDGITHYSVTLHTPDNDAEDNTALRSAFLYPHGWRDGYETVSDVAFSHVKLERGNVATDWTPAPEDLQAEIDAINANPPRINAKGTWEVYVPAEGKYIDTGRTSKGDGLEVIDTRNDNQSPSWYRENHPYTTSREFKILKVIGIPSEWWSGTYCTLETTVRWENTSGGRVEQSTTLDNGTQLRRVGTADDTDWEPWINVSAEIRELETGLANTDTLVSALEKAQSKLDQGILTKADTKDIQYLLDSLSDGATSHKGGILLTNDIILSDPNSKDVTATISGTQTQGANVMRLGISYTCDEDKKATVERAGAKWGINLSSILTGLESDSERIRKLDELGFTIVGGRSLGWPKWEICKATDAKEGGEATALANDGTGHIGELYFSGEEIGFGASDKRYMQIGGTARAEYDMVNASTVIRKFGISGGTVRKSGTFALDTFNSRYSNREIKYTANLSAWAEARAYRVPDNGGWDPNDHRYHKPEYQEFVRTESSATVQLRLELTRGGSTIKTVTSPQVSVSVSAQGGQFGINEEIPQSALYAEDRKSQDVTITISPSDVREQDTVTLSLVTTIRRYCYHHQGSEEIDRYASATASAGSIINFLPYDTSQPMVSVTKDRAAFFYGRSKYILLNYLRDCVMKVVGNMLLQGNLTLKGDLTTDSIICKSGGLYSGGVINEYGTVTRWVGRKITVWKVSTGRYKLSHNLGHINYVVQAIPVHSSDNNCFVIDGTETAHTVEVGVQWNSSWTNRAIHFVIYAQQ